MTVYLDNAATSWPKPPAVTRAAAALLRQPTGNPGRAGHAAATAADRLVGDLRHKLAGLFDHPDPRGVVFGINGTDCLNMAIHGVLGGVLDTAVSGKRGGRRPAARPHVVTSHFDHNSVQRPLQALASAGRIRLTRVGRRGEPIWRAADVLAAIRRDTALVVLTHASNVTGAIGDAAAVTAALRKMRGRNAIGRPWFLLDAAQTAGSLPIAWPELGVDLLAAPGHKGLLGPTGTGVLLIAPALPPLAPWREGGTGLDSTAPLQPEELPTRLEAGTANTFGLAGLSAAIDYLERRGVAAVAAAEAARRRQLIARLRPMKSVRLQAATRAWPAVGVLSVDFRGRLAVSDAAAILNSDFDIATRSGLHCAPYAHALLGTTPAGTLRFSIGPFTTAAEIDRTAEAMDALVKAFGGRPRKGRRR